MSELTSKAREILSRRVGNAKVHPACGPAWVEESLALLAIQDALANGNLSPPSSPDGWVQDERDELLGRALAYLPSTLAITRDIHKYYTAAAPPAPSGQDTRTSAPPSIPEKKENAMTNDDKRKDQGGAGQADSGPNDPPPAPPPPPPPPTSRDPDE